MGAQGLRNIARNPKISQNKFVWDFLKVTPEAKCVPSFVYLKAETEDKPMLPIFFGHNKLLNQTEFQFSFWRLFFEAL